MTKEKKSIKAVMLDMDGTFYMGGMSCYRVLWN